MSKDKEFIFKINAYTPDTIPMARLAEYMAELATLLGEKPHVHFKGVFEGSTNVATIIEHEAEQKVRERLRLVKNNEGPTEALNAFKSINKKLKEDNGDGFIADYDTAEIIAFPGVKEVTLPIFGPISENGSVDGVVIRIGEKNETVTISIETRDGIEIPCKAKRTLAREIGPYIFGQEMRFSGAGKWIRNQDGVWTLEGFRITDYQILDDKPLSETISDLQSVKGSGWANISDPWKELKDIRGDE